MYNEEKASRSALVYVPIMQYLFFLQDGDGSQLSQEDRDNGFDSYIDYKINKYVGNGQDIFFEEGDGGQYLYNSQDVFAWTQMIARAITDACGIDPPMIIYLGTGEVL